MIALSGALTACDSSPAGNENLAPEGPAWYDGIEGRYEWIRSGSQTLPAFYFASDSGYSRYHTHGWADVSADSVLIYRFTELRDPAGSVVSSGDFYMNRLAIEGAWSSMPQNRILVTNQGASLWIDVEENRLTYLDSVFERQLDQTQ